eukprot:463999_1
MLSVSTKNHDLKSIEHKELTQYQHDELMVTGYLHKYMKDTMIPPEIFNLLLLWYHITYKILQFNPEYLTYWGTCKLLDDNKLATRRVTGYASVICDIEPINKGIHCWRIKVINNRHHLLYFGVSSKKKYPAMPNEYDNNYPFWGIGTRDQWFPLNDKNKKTNEISLNTVFNKHINYELDMMLNCNLGMLKFCVVGNCNESSEAKIWGLPNKKEQINGWVPHMNVAGQ